MCGKSFSTKDDMEAHVISSHKKKFEKEKLLRQQNLLLSKINQQRLHIFRTVSDLEKIEFKDKVKCSCKGFCRINHLKHRWTKLKSTSFIRSFNSIIQNESCEDLKCH